MNSICLGIKLGSARIKAVTIGGSFKPISSGDCTWATTGGAHHTV